MILLDLHEMCAWFGWHYKIVCIWRRLFHWELEENSSWYVVKQTYIVDLLSTESLPAIWDMCMVRVTNNMIEQKIEDPLLKLRKLQEGEISLQKSIHLPLDLAKFHRRAYKVYNYCHVWYWNILRVGQIVLDDKHNHIVINNMNYEVCRILSRYFHAIFSFGTWYRRRHTNKGWQTGRVIIDLTRLSLTQPDPARLIQTIKIWSFSFSPRLS